jgi:UDP-N-acetylmuramate dehydrogenase
VTVLDPITLKKKVLAGGECNFKYDYSRFHKTKEIILSAELNLYKGDSKRAKDVFVEWTRRKKVQPQISAGCVFQNISRSDMLRLKLESSSWGYIIDKILDLKGRQIGGAKISAKHAAFIENAGNASAQDVLDLMDLIRKTAKDKLGIEPVPEIFVIGEV